MTNAPRNNVEEILIEQLGGTTSSDSKFIQEYPNGTKYVIYITGEIVGSNHYFDEFKVLQQAGINDIVELHIDSIGGSLATAVMLVGYIKMCKAPVVARVFEAASAATMISLACENVIMMPHSSMMFHTYSEGAYGKGHELKARNEFNEKHIREIMDDVYGGFFSEEEIKYLVEGGDKYLTAEECKQRLAQR